MKEFFTEIFSLIGIISTLYWGFRIVWGILSIKDEIKDLQYMYSSLKIKVNELEKKNDTPTSTESL